MHMKKEIGLYRVAWKIPTVFFLLFLMAFFILQMADLPYTVVRFKEMTNGGTMLDLTWNYSPQLAHEKLYSYGETGRTYYLNMMLVVDLVFPLLYGIALNQMLRLVINWTFHNNKLLLLSWLPLLGTLADFAENASIATLLQTYPGESVLVVELANACTLMKDVFVYGSFTLIVFIGTIGFFSITKRR